MAADPTPEADRNSSFDFAEWGFRPRIKYQVNKRLEALKKKAGVKQPKRRSL